MSDVKSIDSLMRYLREKHNIVIKGSTHKNKLRSIGYYHGYKGYRFIHNSSIKIPYDNFNQVLAINTFDMKLKSLFYSPIMFIETALKNYVLEVILEECKTKNFNTIYETLLTNYKSYRINSLEYKKAIKKRLKLRNQFYSVITRDYSNNKPIIQHFYNKDEPIPIWAIFEVISLGEFGNFVSCLDYNIKRKISKSLNLYQPCDSDGRLTEKIIYILKDLRNSIAHNDVIFDTRFKNSSPAHVLSNSLKQDMNINNINFNTIVDYIILIIYLLKKFNTSKTEMNKLVSSFSYLINQFRNQIPISIYNKIFYTDTRNKINLLKLYIKH